ncbi:MAG: hypothetical protein JKY53_11790 [Flavobacteriales bacterium]|nr:hypothetical protein [Flavobacteriales bacterium]
MNKIDFHETRYINSHVHFYDWKKNGARVQRSYVQPNNKLSIYNCKKNTFVYDFNDEKKHLFQYVVTDSYGNLSRLEFIVQSVIQEEYKVSEKVKLGITYQNSTQSTPNTFATENFKTSLPSKVLYDDIVFEYSVSAPKGRAITPIHNVHSLYEPLHSHMTMSIKVDSLTKRLQSKALIVALDNDYKFIAAEGGTYKNGWITVKTRSFGPYTVMIDTISPSIKAYNIVKGRDMTSRGKLQITISDELSGIKTYRGTVDDKWVLMEYDYKLNRLTYFFDETELEKGKDHVFKLVVFDKQGNESNYSIDFVW